MQIFSRRFQLAVREILIAKRIRNLHLFRFLALVRKVNGVIGGGGRCFTSANRFPKLYVLGNLRQDAKCALPLVDQDGSYVQTSLAAINVLNAFISSIPTFPRLCRQLPQVRLLCLLESGKLILTDFWFSRLEKSIDPTDLRLRAKTAMFFRLVWSSIRSASGSQPQFLAIIQRRVSSELLSWPSSSRASLRYFHLFSMRISWNMRNRFR